MQRGESLKARMRARLILLQALEPSLTFKKDCKMHKKTQPLSILKAYCKRSVRAKISFYLIGGVRIEFF